MERNAIDARARDVEVAFDLAVFARAKARRGELEGDARAHREHFGVRHRARARRE